jgi:hypothetical protein
VLKAIGNSSDRVVDRIDKQNICQTRQDILGQREVLRIDGSMKLISSEIRSQVVVIGEQRDILDDLRSKLDKLVSLLLSFS